MAKARSRNTDSYLSNYTFEVQLGLFTKISFKKISNIASEKECQTIVDGGDNERMFFFEKGNTRPDTIIFERGIQTGTKDAIFGMITEGLKINNIMILVKKGRKTEKIFFIEQGIITKKSFSDLDAMNGELIIKKLEMQHTGIVEIPV